MQNIRVRTAVSVVRDGKLLLFPHTTDTGTLWYLPGGGVGFLEKIEDAAVREYEEETGFKIKLFGEPDIIQYVDKNKPWHSITFAYAGEIIGGELRPELSRWGFKKAVWHSLADLEKIEIVPYLRSQVAKAFEHQC